MVASWYLVYDRRQLGGGWELEKRVGIVGKKRLNLLNANGFTSASNSMLEFLPNSLDRPELPASPRQTV